MKVIDTHTHFKDKFLKVMTDRELELYFASGVEHIIGVIDFFKVQWDEVITEIALVTHCLLLNRDGVDLPRDVIENILKEEIDYTKDQFGMVRLVTKLTRKIQSHARKDVTTLAADMQQICDAVLPADTAERFLKNVKEEILATIQIRSRYHKKAYLALGIHPLAIGHIGSFTDCCRVIKVMEGLIKRCEYVIAIGECGLDHNTPLEQDVFREMLRLGKRLNVPLIMHTPMTHGTIPSKRKCEGIRDMCRIIKEEKVDPKLCVFDHITDHECLDILSKAFAPEKPYVSFSIQAHWLEPQQLADLIKGLKRSWGSRVMVNCDFGTYQTPEAFAVLKILLRKYKVSTAMQRKLLFSNAMKLFDFNRPQDCAFLKRRPRPFVLDMSYMQQPLHLLLVLPQFKKWLVAIMESGLRLSEIYADKEHWPYVKSYFSGTKLEKIKFKEPGMDDNTRSAVLSDTYRAIFQE